MKWQTPISFLDLISFGSTEGGCPNGPLKPPENQRIPRPTVAMALPRRPGILIWAVGLVLLLRPGVAGGFGEAGSLYGMDLDVVHRYWLV